MEHSVVYKIKRHWGRSPVCLILTGFLYSSFYAMADSPIQGEWHNSYCSRMDLTVDENTGAITGIYTSHTGSTGASSVIGYVNPNEKPEPDVPTNPNGIAVSLGIQWRLINVSATEADDSWHWVSTFSGQYHQHQHVSVPNQHTYEIDETLEVLNGLIATATVPGFTNIAPVMWPQTLLFHRNPPDYCEEVEPPLPVPYQASAKDHISGVWENTDRGRLNLVASLDNGEVTGLYQDPTGEAYFVSGLFDTLAPGLVSGVAEQGVTLALYNPDDNKLKIMAGGVNLDNILEMNLWQSNLKSTNWVDRFTESTLEKVIWIKIAD